MSIRPRLSPTIDGLLGAQFLGPFLVCIGAFTIVYILGDMFDRFNDLIHYGGFGLLGLTYFTLKIPLIISQLLPVACLAGVLLGFAMLNRNGEVLACQQLGLSRFEMAVPVILLAAAISLFDTLKRRHLKRVFANQTIWVRVRDGFLSADRFDPKTGTLRGVTLYKIGPDYSLHDIVHSKTATWNGAGWAPDASTTFKLGENGAVSTGDKTLLFGQQVKPSDLSLLRHDPEEFSLWELDHYIRDLRKKGLDPGGYVVDRDLKYAMPLSCLIMVALGIVLSLDPLPRNLSLGRSFGLAIAIGFGYWLALGLTSSLGRSAIIPAWLAAWLPNFTFATIALSIFLFGEER